MRSWLGAVERLGEVGHLVEALELARAARHGRAIPVGRGEEVVRLTRDVDDGMRVGPDGFQLGPHERAGRAGCAAALHLDRSDARR